jgi:hypothetical protein
MQFSRREALVHSPKLLSFQYHDVWETEHCLTDDEIRAGVMTMLFAIIGLSWMKLWYSTKLQYVVLYRCESDPVGGKTLCQPPLL